MSELYFAYGSNLWIDQMIERTGPIPKGAARPRIAWLANYRLVFHMRGDDGEVYANLISPGNGVYGVIYECGPDSLLTLDEFETGYDRREFRVVLENGEERKAIAYFARAAHVGDESPPSDAYLQRILT